MEIPARVGGLVYTYRFSCRGTDGREHEITILIADRRECIIRSFRKFDADSLTWEATLDGAAEISVSDTRDLVTRLRLWLQLIVGWERSHAIVGVTPSPDHLPNCF
jgi:hypothetical protein